MQGSSGHGHRHIRDRHDRGLIQLGRRQLRPAGPSGADPGRRRHWRRDRGWRLRQPPLAQCHHRTRWHGNHPDPQEWQTVEGRAKPPGRATPARHMSLGPGVLETLDGLPPPKPRRGQDAVPKSFGERIVARDPDCQNAEIHIGAALIKGFDALGISRSSAWPEPQGDMGHHASRRLSAATPTSTTYRYVQMSRQDRKVVDCGKMLRTMAAAIPLVDSRVLIQGESARRLEVLWKFSR